MTKEEKRERRRVKHALQKQVFDHHFCDWRYYARPAQFKAAVKVVTDQILAGKNPAEVETL